MTTTLIDKFKAFMSELGYWERFCFAYTESQAYTSSGVDIDTYLSSVEPSEVFNAAQFTDGDELHHGGAGHRALRGGRCTQQ